MEISVLLKWYICFAIFFMSPFLFARDLYSASLVARFETEFVITDLSVVGGDLEPADASWSFSNLVTVLFGHSDAPLAVRDWLLSWGDDIQLGGGTVVQNRKRILDVVIRPWMARDGVDPNQDPVLWTPNLNNAPFRLMAIVNRIDLFGLDYNDLGLPKVTDAGEGRFVFCIASSEDNQCEKFTVIFEYRQDASNIMELSLWARRWHNLSNLAIGTSAFNEALRAITNDFATSNSLKQIRTNEIALEKPWELREFAMTGRRLAIRRVAQTPALRYNEGASRKEFLTTYLAKNLKSIASEVASVPNKFLGGQASLPDDFVWFGNLSEEEANQVPYLARHKFAFQTCNGCHSAETETVFTHILPRRRGREAGLSAFLTGTLDPRFPGGEQGLEILSDRAETQVCRKGEFGTLDPVNKEPRCFGDLLRRAGAVDAIMELFDFFVLSKYVYDNEIDVVDNVSDGVFEISRSTESDLLRRLIILAVPTSPGRVH